MFTKTHVYVKQNVMLRFLAHQNPTNKLSEPDLQFATSATTTAASTRPLWY